MITLERDRQAMARADRAWAVLRRHAPGVDRHDLSSLSFLRPDVLREALVAADVSVPFVDVYSPDPARREPLPQVLLATSLMLVLGALEVFAPWSEHAAMGKPAVDPANFTEPETPSSTLK